MSPSATATVWFTLVNDILDFERIGSGKLRLETSEISAFDILRRASDLQQASAQRAGLTFRIDAQPIHLRVDSERILQTLS